jgi:hypothetical protein
LSAVTLSLHVPDEPTARAEAWLAAVLEGADLRDVLRADDGLASWLWQRWTGLAAAGLSKERFVEIVLDNRRELWLWLAGERTWAHVCSGLLGRVSRRLTPADVS